MVSTSVGKKHSCGVLELNAVWSRWYWSRCYGRSLLRPHLFAGIKVSFFVVAVVYICTNYCALTKSQLGWERYWCRDAGSCWTVFTANSPLSSVGPQRQKWTKSTALPTVDEKSKITRSATTRLRWRCSIVSFSGLLYFYHILDCWTLTTVYWLSIV